MGRKGPEGCFHRPPAEVKPPRPARALGRPAGEVGFLEEDMDRPVNLFSGGWKAGSARTGPVATRPPGRSALAGGELGKVSFNPSLAKRCLDRSSWCWAARSCYRMRSNPICLPSKTSSCRALQVRVRSDFTWPVSLIF